MIIHCMKCVQIWSFFWSVFSRIRTEYGNLLRKSLNGGKYGSEKTPYLDTFQAVIHTNLDMKYLSIFPPRLVRGEICKERILQ